MKTRCDVHWNVLWGLPDKIRLFSSNEIWQGIIALRHVYILD